MEYMEPLERTDAALEVKDHYGRDTFVGRVKKLMNDSAKRPYAVFEMGLNMAGTDVEQLQDWINDPVVLEDAQVEPFMRRLAILMGDMKMELGEGKNPSLEASKNLQKALSSLIKEFFS